MIRISLIIAIIAGVAALTISQLKVANKINTLTSDLETTKQTLATSQEAERKAKKDAKDATAAADAFTGCSARWSLPKSRCRSCCLRPPVC